MLSDRIETNHSDLLSSGGALRAELAETAKSADARSAKLKDDVDGNVQRLLAAFGNLQAQ
eukprot:SAG22_NODE_2976_length_2057_cov_1.168029_1_plen_59_part_10